MGLSAPKFSREAGNSETLENFTSQFVCQALHLRQRLQEPT